MRCVHGVRLAWRELRSYKERANGIDPQTDFLPAAMSGNLAPLIEQGSQALKKNLEKR
jgi:hypothetical protein